MRLAVIPARGGSKRIPRKNIREFYGKPMIAWSIEAALDSGLFDKVIVSTDDEDIANVALANNAEVPFMRPEDLSDDHVGTIPVVQHAIRWYDEKGFRFDQICCIYATAPFIRSSDLRLGLEALEENLAEYAISVSSFPSPIQRAIKMTKKGRLQMFHPECFNVRSQDLEPAFHDAGQFYWGTHKAWVEEIAIFSEKTAPVVIPRIRVQDIDTPEDWEHAETLFKALRFFDEGERRI